MTGEFTALVKDAGHVEASSRVQLSSADRHGQAAQGRWLPHHARLAETKQPHAPPYETTGRHLSDQTEFEGTDGLDSKKVPLILSDDGPPNGTGRQGNQDIVGERVSVSETVSMDGLKLP